MISGKNKEPARVASRCTHHRVARYPERSAGQNCRIFVNIHSTHMEEQTRIH